MNIQQYSNKCLLSLLAIVLFSPLRGLAQMDFSPPTNLAQMDFSPPTNLAQIDFSALMGLAQMDCFDGEPKDKFHITLSVGPTLLHGSIPVVGNQRVGFGSSLKLDYRIYRGLLLGVEGQLGNLKAGGIDTIQQEAVVNRYRAGFVNVTIFPFQFGSETYLKHPGTVKILLKSWYIGFGIGGLYSKYTYLRDVNGNVLYGLGADDTITDKPRQKTRSVLLPVVNTGLAVPLNKYGYKNNPKKYWSVVGNAQFNFGNDDELDGFVLPDEDHKYKYTFLSIGVRYSF